MTQTDALDNKLRNQGIFPSHGNSDARGGAYDGQARTPLTDGRCRCRVQFQPTAFGEAMQQYALPANLGIQLDNIISQPILACLRPALRPDTNPRTWRVLPLRLNNSNGRLPATNAKQAAFLSGIAGVGGVLSAREVAKF
jgi:hypothetical protein